MLTTDEIELLRGASHSDPFAVLGLHRLDGGTWSLRACLPGAAQVVVHDVATGKVRGMLIKRHEDGVFEGPIKTDERFAYRFQVRWQDGTNSALEDAYRFPPLLGERDVWLLAEGLHLRPYEALGAQPRDMDGVPGTGFAVWAPNASHVSVVGDFNAWDARRHPMRLRAECGVWEIFVPGVALGAAYKYEIRSLHGQLLPLKADPYALRGESHPATASIVSPLPPRLVPPETRRPANASDAPISIYEVHAASWRHKTENGLGRWLDWRELADTLIPYVRDMGFTHLQLMPINAHPHDGSWGHQPIALYAPTARFGNPADFRAFVERCHAEGIGLLLDGIPAHFPNDVHGLALFDGTHLYEHADRHDGIGPDANRLTYDVGRPAVRNFLVGNALYWIERFGVDGLRVEAVAWMPHREPSDERDERIPPMHSDHDTLESIAFLKRMNEVIGIECPDAVTMAEASTSNPGVTRPTPSGGLGFHYAWNRRWTHDTLRYMARDPMHRPHHHDEISAGPMYAFTENFVLPLSHDEVVHGKGSLLNRMPGDEWQRFANLRAYYGFMFGHPGKKLMFMGNEFAQEREWDQQTSLDWHLLGDSKHEGVQRLMHDLNHLYKETPALYERDVVPEGFEWIDARNAAQSVLSFLRYDAQTESMMLVVCNFTPTVHPRWRIGVPRAGRYAERINTDSFHYGGGNHGTPLSMARAEPTAWDGRAWSVVVTLPPLATVLLEWAP